ncbi:MAG: ABC transporter ATP-binding protein [Smithellaceae bacterium]
MKALSISGLTFSYNAAADKSADNIVEYALKDFSLEVESGQIYALLGPNGAGKTTLMRVITGQLRGYAGSVSICGDKAPEMASLKNIGYAPQPVSVFTTLTAAENLRFFGVMAGLTGEKLQDRSEAVLEETGLVQHAHKKASTYSGGMLRRLNLAVALLHEPELLLLDEPTVGVDPQSRHHIYETLNRLNSAGKTILLCTHIMDEAQRLCSRVTMVDRGAAVFAGDMAGIDNLERFFLEKTGHGLRDE